MTSSKDCRTGAVSTSAAAGLGWARATADAPPPPLAPPELRPPPLAVGASPDVVAQCYLAGGCKDIQRLPFGQYLFSRGVAVMRNAPNPDAAKVWVNWFLSKEGQETFVREWVKYNDSGAVSFRKDVAADPKHKNSEPDYTKMDKYFLAGAEAGESVLSSVIKMYTAIKNR